MESCSELQQLVDINHLVWSQIQRQVHRQVKQAAEQHSTPALHLSVSLTPDQEGNSQATTTIFCSVCNYA